MRLATSHIALLTAAVILAIESSCNNAVQASHVFRPHMKSLRINHGHRPVPVEKLGVFVIPEQSKVTQTEADGYESMLEQEAQQKRYDQVEDLRYGDRGAEIESSPDYTRKDQDDDWYGYDESIPTPKWTGTSCSSGYDAKVKNWGEFAKAVKAYLDKPGGKLGPDGVPYKRVAAMFIRSGFHDAGAYSTSRTYSARGGADGSLLLTKEEQDWGGNNVPLRYVPYVRAALLPLVQKYDVSWADAIAVAGAVAALNLGNAWEFYVKVGRCDNPVVNPDVLPAPDIKFKAFREYWESLGLSISDGAALIGSHVILEDGRGHSDGKQQYKWTNKFYTDTWAGDIQVVDKQIESNRRGYDMIETTSVKAVEWSAGNWQYTISDAYNAPINLHKFDDDSTTLGEAPAVPKMGMDSKLREYLLEMLEYTLGNEAWFKSYSRSYKKLTEVGATFGKGTAQVLLKPVSKSEPTSSVSLKPITTSAPAYTTITTQQPPRATTAAAVPSAPTTTASSAAAYNGGPPPTIKASTTTPVSIIPTTSKAPITSIAAVYNNNPAITSQPPTTTIVSATSTQPAAATTTKAYADTTTTLAPTTTSATAPGY